MAPPSTASTSTSPYFRLNFWTVFRNVSWELRTAFLSDKVAGHLLSLWDYKELDSHKGIVKCLLLLQQRLYTAGYDRRLVAYDASGVIDNELLVIRVKRRAHQAAINCLAGIKVDKDTCLLATGGFDSYIKIWNGDFSLFYRINSVPEPKKDSSLLYSGSEYQFLLTVTSCRTNKKEQRFVGKGMDEVLQRTLAFTLRRQAGRLTTRLRTMLEQGLDDAHIRKNLIAPLPSQLLRLPSDTSVLYTEWLACFTDQLAVNGVNG
nr:unnamed protein product [Spirometra erinaceieuropaei]